MNTTTSTIGAKGASASHRKGAPFAARLALRFLERIDSGRLHVELPSGSRLAFGPGGTEAEIVFHDWHAFGRILRDGDIGFAEGFLEQQWHTPDLPGLLILLAANRKALDAPLYGSIAGRLIHRIAHALRSNTRAGSRRNIAAHYDLGNDFYSLWLDPGMTYSSALFESPTQTLEAAQRAKYQRILDRIAPAPGSHILEIGAGWGGFAELAAAEKCRVTGLTLSREQLEYARHRLACLGHSESTSIEFRDYRDEAGTYDAVVSIEMFEAVGERWWPAYFGKVAAALRPGGKAVIQAIVIADELFERYRKGSDFIQQYIFPGGMLASPSRIRALAQEAGFGIEDEFRFGPDYGRTLAAWREQFLAKAESVRALGFDERFMRMWEFYFAYCEAGFATRSTDVMHFTLAKR
jgi:cyclopropane-fatty-acyl-phospholipid synthase